MGGKTLNATAKLGIILQREIPRNKDRLEKPQDTPLDLRFYFLL